MARRTNSTQTLSDKPNWKKQTKKTCLKIQLLHCLINQGEKNVMSLTENNHWTPF